MSSNRAKNKNKPSAGKSGNLMVVFMTADDDYMIDQDSRLLAHLRRHMDTFEKVSVRIVTTGGDVTSLRHKDGGNDHIACDNRSSREFVDHLTKREKVNLSEDKIDKAIIVSDSFDDLTPEAEDTLGHVLMRHMKNDAVVRMQKCQFAESGVKDAIPGSCRAVVPEEWSIISSKDTRAIDFNSNERHFNAIKAKDIFRQNRSNEEVKRCFTDELDAYVMGGSFYTFACFDDDGVDLFSMGDLSSYEGIYLVLPDGKRESIPWSFFEAEKKLLAKPGGIVTIMSHVPIQFRLELLVKDRYKSQVHYEDIDRLIELMDRKFKESVVDPLGRETDTHLNFAMAINSLSLLHEVVEQHGKFLTTNEWFHKFVEEVDHGKPQMAFYIVDKIYDDDPGMQRDCFNQKHWVELAFKKGGWEKEDALAFVQGLKHHRDDLSKQDIYNMVEACPALPNTLLFQHIAAMVEEDSENIAEMNIDSLLKYAMFASSDDVVKMLHLAGEPLRNKLLENSSFVEMLVLDKVWDESCSKSLLALYESGDNLNRLFNAIHSINDEYIDDIYKIDIEESLLFNLSANILNAADDPSSVSNDSFRLFDQYRVKEEVLQKLSDKQLEILFSAIQPEIIFDKMNVFENIGMFSRAVGSLSENATAKRFLLDSAKSTMTSLDKLRNQYDIDKFIKFYKPEEMADLMSEFDRHDVRQMLQTRPEYIKVFFNYVDSASSQEDRAANMQSLGQAIVDSLDDNLFSKNAVSQIITGYGIDLDGKKIDATDVGLKGNQSAFFTPRGSEDESESLDEIPTPRPGRLGQDD